MSGLTFSILLRIKRTMPIAKGPEIAANKIKALTVGSKVRNLIIIKIRYSIDTFYDPPWILHLKPIAAQ